MSDQILHIPAIKVTQPIGEFFVASIEARKLVEISYSDVRALQRDFERHLGIQRELKKDRVKAIRKYLLNSKDASFPTSIILAIDERCAEYDSQTGVLTLYPTAYESDGSGSQVSFDKIAKILDGQHRIAGFLEGDGAQQSFSFEREFFLNVSIFIGIDISEQAKIFATVNLAQTKVNKSLVYDLEDLARKRNPYKSCHHIAVAMDANEDSPLYRRIKRLGVATPGRVFEPLTQASFVEALVPFLSDDPDRDRNLLLDGKKLPELNWEKHPFALLFRQGEEGDVDIYRILKNYFEAVQRKWPAAWNDVSRSGNLLPKSNAFKALMRYLKNDVYLKIAKYHGDIPTPEDFAQAFDHVTLSDADFTTRNFAPGSGGQSMFYKVLTGQIDEKSLFDE